MPTSLPWVIYLQYSTALSKSAPLRIFNALTYSNILNFTTISSSTPNNSVETNPVYTQSTASVSTTNYVQQNFTKSSKARRPLTFLCSHSPAPSIIITTSSQQHNTHKISILIRPPLAANQSIDPRLTGNMTPTPPSTTITATTTITTTTKPSFLPLRNTASGYQAPSNHGRNSESCMNCGGTSFDADATKTWCRGCGKIQ
jgi:hypothetical protein